MALKKCKECGKEISTKAKTCPGCGAPVKAAPKQIKTKTGCLIIGGVILFIILLFNYSNPKPTSVASKPPKQSSAIVDLNAAVSFNGAQFVITNGDSFDWTNVKLEINSKTFSSGYTLKASILKAGEVYTVGAMQFAKPDGAKFNPFTHKAQNLSVWCDTPKGQGFYYGAWN